jgi:hypothetical protein
MSKTRTSPNKLSAIDLTNGEFAKLSDIVDCLEYMRIERIEVPINGTELEAILTRYVIHFRGEQMDRLCAEGKITPRIRSARD